MLYKTCCKHEEEPLQRSAKLFVEVIGAKQLAFRCYIRPVVKMRKSHSKEMLNYL